MAFSGNIKYANNKVIFAVFYFVFIKVPSGGEDHKILCQTKLG